MSNSKPVINFFITTNSRNDYSIVITKVVLTLTNGMIHRELKKHIKNIWYMYRSRSAAAQRLRRCVVRLCLRGASGKIAPSLRHSQMQGAVVPRRCYFVLSSTRCAWRGYFFARRLRRRQPAGKFALATRAGCWRCRRGAGAYGAKSGN
jgi:hypothetical protein